MPQTLSAKGGSFFSAQSASPRSDAGSVLSGGFQQYNTTLLIAFLVVVGLSIVFGQKKKSLPPGVKPLPRLPGLPYAGRFWDVPGPGIEAALHFGGLHKKYGPIYEWKVMGVTHVWVETDKVARDLFVTRQRKYGDRNELPGALGVKEDCEILPLSGYSEDFKRHKNFIHTIMRQSNPKAFYGWPLRENMKTLRRLIESPDRWSEHMITHCARTIASIAWADPDHGKKLLYVVPDLLKAVSPEGPIVNKLTFLKYLPASISPFKAKEQQRKQDMTDAFYEALDDVNRRIQEGEVPECWSSLWLKNEKSVHALGLDRHEAAYAIGSSSFVAIATIGGPLHSFYLAMAYYPEWLPKLQEEVDRVCGSDRIPTAEDMPNLPRLRATAKEVLRWRQSTPLGVPHECMEDDIYEGHIIRKGSMLHANHYLISREAHKYPNGDQFVPERWLDPKYPTYKEPLTEFPNLRADTSFGYGNRACPGVDLTQMELVTLFGALVWAFDIKKPANSGPLPWYEVNPYVITMNKSFPMSIVPRSAEKKQWVLDNVGDAGYTLVTDETKKSRWDVVHNDSTQPWTWEGLALPFQAPPVPIVYPPGH